MADKVRILGPDGAPLQPAPRRKIAGVPRNGRAQALVGQWNGFGGPAYDAADVYDQHMAAWTPYLWSPDAELNI